jgi:hypothetical protein
MNTRDLILDALEKRALADIDTAEANIQLYLDHAVGVGEHGKIVEEVETLVDQAAAARDRLEVIRKIKSSK